MRNRLFNLMARYAVNHPWRVIGLFLVLAVVSAFTAATRLEVRTSNLDLIDGNLPDIKRFTDFAGEFGTPNVLVVVLEGNDPRAMEQAVDELGPALRLVPGIRNVIGKIPFDETRLREAGVEPYLAARDQSVYLLFAQPDDDRSQVDTIAPMVAGVRQVLADHQLSARGITAGLTGIPEYAINDREVIEKDISFLSLVSFAMIGGLFVVAFAAWRRPLMAMITLGVSVVVIVGLIALYPGHLTLLSAFFASILFGLGIDYGIHIINRVEELTGEGMSERDAIVKSISGLAPELTTGALTTSAVFLSMMASGFKGFSELGLIAGVGILVCLLMMSSLLPALLMLVPHRSPGQIVSRQSRVGRLLMGLQRGWITTPLLVVTVGVCLLGGPGFDGDYTHIQPADSEAVRLERVMVDRTSLSPQFAAFTLNSKAEAIALADRLLDEKTVGEVRSIADLEMLAPAEGAQSSWPPEFVRGFVSASNHYAVYAYPSGNVWNPVEQDAFIADMQAYDPLVTGMPFLGKFMTGRSEHALFVTAVLGGALMMLCVWLNYRRVLPSLLAVTPTLLTVAAMHGIMSLLNMPFNSINIMALPVILGIAVDDGVHMVHRFIAEKGDVARTLAGSGRSVVLTSLTTIAAFASLAFTRHRGLASFSILLVIGVTLALLISVVLLPMLLKRVEKKLLKA